MFSGIFVKVGHTNDLIGEQLFLTQKQNYLFAWYFWQWSIKKNVGGVRISLKTVIVKYGTTFAVNHVSTSQAVSHWIYPTIFFKSKPHFPRPKKGIMFQNSSVDRGALFAKNLNLIHCHVLFYEQLSCEQMRNKIFEIDSLYLTSKLRLNIIMIYINIITLI